MNFKTSILTFACAAMLTSCGGEKSNEPLLTMYIEGTAPDMLLNYSPTGNIYANQAYEVTPDSLGNFTFNPELPKGVDFVDGEIYIGDNVYGYYIEKGKPLQMDIRFDGNGKAEVTYSGDNAAAAETVTLFSNAFDLMRYMPMELGILPEAEYDSLLTAETARAREAASKLSGDQAEYFNKIADAKNLFYTIRGITDRGLSPEEFTANEKYKELVSRIDPNDPISAKTNLLFIWLNNASGYKSYGGNADVATFVEELKTVDANVTNPVNRVIAFESVASSLFNYTKPTKAQMKEFLDSFAVIAKDQPEMLKNYTARMDALIEILPGSEVPYDPTLERPDGSKVKLSELKGKPLYIDIWATWCGPCCREIPFLEKVVERRKGNDSVRIISISCDEDRDAWIAKLDKDKPEWEQFRFVENEGNTFMGKLGISGIPRFMMLDREGKFVAPDAARPSDENIDEKLNELAK